MKKTSTLLLLLLALCPAIFGQVRHVKGIKSVDAGYGITQFGNVYSASYVQYFGPKFYGKLTGFYEAGSHKEVNYSSAGVDFTPTVTLAKIGESIFINGQGGLTFSIDKITKGSDNISVPTTFKYGVFFGGEVESFINDKFVFIVSANQRFLLGSNFGSYRWFASAGIRYNF